MSATAEQNLAPGGQDGAVGGAGSDPGPIQSHAVPAEEVRIEEAASPQAFQVAERAPPEEEGGQEAARAAAEETLHVQQTEHGKEEEVDVEAHGEEYKNEEEEKDDDNELRNDEDQEEEEDFGEEEDDEGEEDDEDEEEEDSEEEEEDGQQLAGAIGSPREYPMVRFRSLLWGLLHSLLHHFHHNDHILVRPHPGFDVLEGSPWEPEDPEEEPAHWEGDDLTEEDAPQEPEESQESEEAQEPEEGAISGVVEEPTPEARVSEGEDITGAIMPYDEMGACAPEEAEAGRGRQHPQALVVSVEAAGSLGGRAQGLPRVVKRRVNALKNLQAEYAQIEAQYYKDLYSLERKYAALYQPLFDKRSDIINAIYEPTEDECQWEVGVQKGVCEETESEPEGKPPVNGIPHFWLTAFKNIKILRKLIQENDELILAHLKDVKIKFSGVEEPKSFTIEFVFKSNEYFFNEVLTKTYHMRSQPDDSDPFFSRGPEIISSSGCKIYWKQGKNVTMKILNLQQCEGHGSVVSTIYEVPSYSFFIYFYPPDSPQGRLLGVAVDYELGCIFRDFLVPKPVLFFTKEAIECYYEDSDEESQESGSEEEKIEEEEDEEPEEGPEKDPGPAEGSPRKSSWQA